jgi:sirohydrochlorin cobaltochelatase
MQPTLADAITELAAQDARHITVIPLFLARGGHLKEDLPVLIGKIQLLHPQLAFHIAPAIGEADELLHSIADWARQEHLANSSN